MERELFVFAGQSNMVGGSVYPPKRKFCLEKSYEYKHKPRRLGAESGEFVSASYPVGEFSYIKIDEAYDRNNVDNFGKSLISDYRTNTYFSPSMSNLLSKDDLTVRPFSDFSEATAPHGATLAPFIAAGWEQCSRSSAYAHIAKGGVSIDYYLTREMRAEYSRLIKDYNAEHGTDYDEEIVGPHLLSGAPEYFIEKCVDFFSDAESHFAGDDMTNKCLIWLQGEADAYRSAAEYEMKLSAFWKFLKPLGFTHFFIVRVDYFGDERIARIMQAQENFASSRKDVYILTRVASYLTYPYQDEEKWFVRTPTDEERECRDSFFGFDNNHINEKGFSVIAERCVKNLYRILVENNEPMLEDENIRSLVYKSEETEC